MLRCPPRQRYTAGRGQGAPRACSATLSCYGVFRCRSDQRTAQLLRSGDRLTSRDEVWAGPRPPCQFRSSNQYRQIGGQVHYPWRRGWQSSDPVGHRGHDVTIPAPSPVQAGQYLPGRGPGTQREPGIPARGTDYRLRHLGQFQLGFDLLASDLGSCGLNGKRGLSLLACLLNSRDHLAQAVHEELHFRELARREHRGG